MSLPGIDVPWKAKAVPVSVPEACMQLDENGTPRIKDSLRIPHIISGPPEQTQIVAARSSAGLVGGVSKAGHGAERGGAVRFRNHQIEVIQDSQTRITVITPGDGESL